MTINASQEVRVLRHLHGVEMLLQLGIQRALSADR